MRNAGQKEKAFFCFSVFRLKK